MREPHLLNGVMWSVVGNTCYAACQCAMLIVLAKLGNPQMVGLFALGLAISGPIFLLANLQIRAIQSTDVAGDHHFGEYLGLRVITSATALIVVYCITLIAGYCGEIQRVALAVGVFKAIEAVSDVF